MPATPSSIIVDQLLEAGHRRVQADAPPLVELDGRLPARPVARGRYGQAGSGVVVPAARVGDDGVEAVVAAPELDHDQDAVLGHPRLARQRRALRLHDAQRRALDEERRRGRHRRQGHALLEKHAPRKCRFMLGHRVGPI
jgi:hypothetical protein